MPANHSLAIRSNKSLTRIKQTHNTKVPKVYLAYQRVIDGHRQVKNIISKENRVTLIMFSSYILREIQKIVEYVKYA